MNIKDVEKFARFLAQDYPFDVRTKVNACPVCFSNKNSTTSVIKAKKTSRQDSPTSKYVTLCERYNIWMNLFVDEGLDPIQCINEPVDTFYKAWRHTKLREHGMDL